MSRVLSFVNCGSFPQFTKTRFGAWPPSRRRARPGCLLRKGGDVPGKEVNGAYERLTSLPFEAGSFALPAVELRWLNLIRAG
ncbi:hypothetical protein [Paenibacillus sp. CH40]|uniref:hypothetical protein n=1 Tax=Paenibacillus sp. CH40 TaxID=2962045 RepID=UPI0020B85BD5|nr:hypothetical protein [Paenibacillus sp. CH40]MCP3796872.1 hypothetical protein [Paenibacillus sp. CH40]